MAFEMKERFHYETHYGVMHGTLPEKFGRVLSILRGDKNSN